MWQAEHFSRSALGYAAPLPAAALHRLEFGLACAVVYFAPINVLRLPNFYFTLSDAFACLCLGTMMINGTIKLRVLAPAITLLNEGPRRRRAP